MEQKITFDYILYTPKEKITASEIIKKNNTLHAKFYKQEHLIAELSESIEKINNSIIKVKRCWNILTDEPCSYGLCLTYNSNKKTNVFLPSVLYNENKEGLGKFPRLDLSKKWSFFEERTSLPSCCMFYEENENIMFWKEANEQPLFQTSLSFDCEKKQIELNFPAFEAPYSYTSKKNLIKTKGRLFTTEKKITLVAYIQIDSDDYLTSYTKALRFLFNTKQIKPYEKTDFSKYVYLKFLHLCDLLSFNASSGLYLRMGKDNGTIQEVYEFTAASFLVKSMEAANIFIYAHRHNFPLTEVTSTLIKELHSNEKEIYKDIALHLAKYFLQAEQKPGVFQDCQNLQTHRWGGYLGIGEHPEYATMVNARCAGEALLEYVELSKSLKSMHIEHTEIKEMLKRVSLFFVNAQLSSGSYGRWFDSKGKPINISGTNGAHILRFLIAYDYKTYEKSIQKAALFYSQLCTQKAFYGDTLDADSFDKEAGVVLLAALLDLYEKTKEEQFLLSAKKAAEFISTWIFLYDIPFKHNTNAYTAKLRTMGLTAVSVAHHHLDTYGMAIAYEYLRLFSYTQDALYSNLADLLMNACNQLIDETGYQPEQINHTQWDYFGDEKRFSGSFHIDIAWVVVLGLNAFLKIKVVSK